MHIAACECCSCRLGSLGGHGWESFLYVGVEIVISNLKAREALHKWPGVEDRRMHENLLLFSTYSLVLGKTTSWSGLSFLHAPLQASPTRCPLTSCPPVRRRPRPPLPKMNTTRMGIWTSLGPAQVSLSWWSGRVLMLGGE